MYYVIGIDQYSHDSTNPHADNPDDDTDDASPTGAAGVPTGAAEGSASAPAPHPHSGSAILASAPQLPTGRAEAPRVLAPPPSLGHWKPFAALRPNWVWGGIDVEWSIARARRRDPARAVAAGRRRRRTPARTARGGRASSRAKPLTRRAGQTASRRRQGGGHGGGRGCWSACPLCEIGWG